jgi:8-oxo-dGTP diphosphatase
MDKFFDRKLNLVKTPLKKDISWRISTYAVIRDQEKLLVVLPKYNNLYDLPGGGVNIDESAEEALVRECYEETGYKVKISSSKPLYVSESNFYAEDLGKYFHSVNLFYLAKLVNKKQNKSVINKIEKDEIDQVLWTNIRDLNKKNCHHLYLPVLKLLKVKK